MAASKPQFKEMKLDLEKMMGLPTHRRDAQDAAFMSGFGNAFIWPPTGC